MRNKHNINIKLNHLNFKPNVYYNDCTIVKVIKLTEYINVMLLNYKLLYKITRIKSKFLSRFYSDSCTYFVKKFVIIMPYVLLCTITIKEILIFDGGS